VLEIVGFSIAVPPIARVVPMRREVEGQRRVGGSIVRTLEYALRDLAVVHHSREGDMNVKPLNRLLGLLGLVAPLLMASTAAAQTTWLNSPTTTTGRVIIGPVTGTLGLQGTVDKFYSDIHEIVKAAGITDGTKRARVHGLEAIDSLRPGAPVVAQYAVKGVQASAYTGSGGLNVNEGIVTKVDRSRNRITIRFSQGTTETLRSTKHATQDADGSVHSRVIVYHANDSGQLVAHYFKPVH